MKRNSQSRTEHQKAEPAAPKNPAISENTQSNQYHCGLPECDQPAAPGTAMEFSFKGCSVRTVHQGKDTWFVAADVCAVLELTNPTKAILRLDEDEKGLTTIQGSSGRQELNVVNESGLYHLVPLHSGFDGLSVSGIERGQVGAVHLDGDAPSCAGVA